MSDELKSTQIYYGENVLMMRVDDCLIFGNKDALRRLAEKLEERTVKALRRKLDAVVRFEEGGVTFTYDKGTSILHECESCGTFVKPGEIYCHNCGARLEWDE